MEERHEVIAIGSDHAGYVMKEYLKKILLEWDYMYEDFGTFSEQSVDYPDIIHPLAMAIEVGVYKKALIICGSGNGAAMVANKYPHLRAAVCWEEEIVRLARQHNDANILALPARFITNVHASEFLRIFLTTGFEGGRHEQRVKKIERTSL
jgi:ribose 5-phosphate isomerase B